jgi:hypothetical protein
MGAVVRLMPGLPIVEMVTSGYFSAEEGGEVMGKGISLSIENDIWNVLADFTAMTHTALPADIIALADALKELGVADRFREAVVRPTDVVAAVWVDLWEKAAMNRGIAVKSFRDRESAIGWLLKTEPST